MESAGLVRPLPSLSNFQLHANNPGEQRELVARAVRGRSTRQSTNRVQAALRTAVRSEARTFLRTFSSFFPDSVDDRRASVPPQRIARMLEHGKRCIQKVIQSQFPGSAGFFFAFLAASDTSDLLSAAHKSVLMFSKKMHSIFCQGKLEWATFICVLKRAPGNPRIATEAF